MCKEIYGRETEWTVRGGLSRQGCDRLWALGEGEGSRDKSVTGPTKDKHCLHGFGCVWLPRGCLLPLVALTHLCSAPHQLPWEITKSSDPSCVPTPCTAKAADLWAHSSLGNILAAETRKWTTLLNRECVLMPKKMRFSVLAQEPSKEGQLWAQAGRQSHLGRGSAEAVGSLASWLEQPLCCCSMTAAPKHCCHPNTRK